MVFELTFSNYMNYSFVYPVAIISILLISCNKESSARKNSESQKISTLLDTTCLTLDSLKNAMVNDEDYGLIRLQNGKYKNDSEQVDMCISDEFTFADLNGDGYKDAIGSIGVNTGGTGTFLSLDVFLNKQGSAVHTASYFLGDRVGPDSIRVISDTINLYFMKRTQGEPMSGRGSIPVHKKFKLVERKLIELKN